MMNMADVRSNIVMDYGEVKRANITTNHAHAYGLKHQESYLKFEGTQGAIKIRFGLLMDYPEGIEDAFEYCPVEAGKNPEWISVNIDGTWFPDAFIGSMASLMRKVEGSSDELPTATDDAYKTMVCVEAAYQSSASGAMPVLYS
jgi:predicted dehydrogenase